jgi:hypothetical protein
MTLKLLSRARHLWCGPTKIRGTTWLGSMKHKPQEKNKRASNGTMQHHWREMNRKQRRETMWQIQSEDLSLEVIHPDATGIDMGNETHYVAVPRSRDSQPVRRFGYHSGVEGDGRLVGIYHEQ